MLRQHSEASSPQFGFDLNALRPGDVLLSVDTGKVSRRIAQATGGEYSHAMLYVGHSIIHAMTDGVYSKNPQRYLRGHADHLAAYRLISSTGESADLKVVCDYARSQVGALYSISQAALVGLRRTRITRVFDFAGKQFCSRLVAQAYSEIGVQLVDDVDYCSPNDFTRSSKIFRVSGSVRQVSTDEIEFSKTLDVNEIIQQRTFLWLDKTRRLAARKRLGVVAVHNDVLRLLVRNPIYDRVVSSYVINSGYADFYNWDRTKNPYRYDTGSFLSTFSTKEELVRLLHGEWPSLQADVERLSKNIQASSENFARYRYLEYVRLEHDLADKLFREMMLRKKTWFEAAKVLGVDPSEVAEAVSL